MARILIVEDEPRIASFLEKGLRGAAEASSDGVADQPTSRCLARPLQWGRKAYTQASRMRVAAV